jgi:branched-chain amino acid transport system ATP-binding protein
MEGRDNLSDLTIPQLLRWRVRQSPDGVALREKEFGCWNNITWSRYYEQVRRAALGLRRTFQTDQIAEDLSLKQNVQAIADHVHYDSRADYDKAVMSAIAFVGLAHRANRRGSELSTEERHLAEIAKALIGKPRLVMLDEPGAGMSQSESAHLVRVIRDIPAFAKAQVFLIDHDVELISACCHETMVLDFGRLLALGPTLDVLKNPEVQRAYLGSFDALEEVV